MPTKKAADPALDQAVTPVWAQEGDVLTTATGTPVDNTDDSLKVGLRCSTLLMDHHLREKIMHFDHERITERVVHARGTGAHGWAWWPAPRPTPASRPAW